MSNYRETPERRRERMRQEELKRNPLYGGGLTDLVLSSRLEGAWHIYLTINFSFYYLFSFLSIM
ncbi:DUF6366 family protein [Metabacillus litoralis]|uniref:DUF6366 family protein n=1 Tax=Metabacillus litoralis TaxID=152268 RepID=UPI003084213B